MQNHRSYFQIAVRTEREWRSGHWSHRSDHESKGMGLILLLFAGIRFNTCVPTLLWRFTPQVMASSLKNVLRRLAQRQPRVTNPTHSPQDDLAEPLKHSSFGLPQGGRGPSCNGSERGKKESLLRLLLSILIGLLGFEIWCEQTCSRVSSLAPIKLSRLLLTPNFPLEF